MKRLNVPWLALWLGPRAYWALSILAMLFAAAAPLHAVLFAAYAGAAAFAVLIVADAVLIRRAAAFEMTRRPPEPFAMGRRASLGYILRNHAAYALRTGSIEAPLHLLRYECDELTVRVPPASEVRVERAVLPVARGSGDLQTLFAWYETPIGLLRRRMRVAAGASVRVYPDLSAVERYGSLQARNRLIESGLRRMRLRGAGTEPESVREWEAGDAFRAIDWKATARTGKVMVVQYEVERSQNVVILLDAGRLMMPRIGLQRKFDYAVTAALSVASIAALANDKVGVVAFAGEILRASAPRQHGRSLERLAQEMHDIEPRFEEADYDKAFAYLRAHVHKRSLIVFFTDMIDPAAQSSVLAQLATLSRRHLVICAFMNDAAVETALEREPADAREAYTQSVALDLQAERRLASATLVRMGVRAIDVPARLLTTTLIDRYLQIKQRVQL
ncbi:MAG: DUF58 domain-containing protein [Candidatus Baltobacteraceae bacterium]